MSRIDSPFNTLISRLDEMIGLKLRQMKPLLGLKRVPPLGPCVLRAKGESNGLQRLSLEPFCTGTVCHLLRACHRRIFGQQRKWRASGSRRLGQVGDSIRGGENPNSPAMIWAREAEW